MRELRVDQARIREPTTDEATQAVSLPEPIPIRPSRPTRQNARGKFAAGVRGLKHALRGDSSYFAHAYRGTLFAVSAVLLGVDALGWCFLVIAAAFVLLTEITHSAVDVLAKSSDDTTDGAATVAREIAAAGVLIAAFVSGGITVTVLTVKFGEMFGWWGR